MLNIDLTKLKYATPIVSPIPYIATMYLPGVSTCALNGIETDNEEEITEVKVKRFRLTNIPEAMRKMKNPDGSSWYIAPKIMEKWFSLPAYVMDLKLKTGKITEAFYLNINDKIDKYLAEIKKYEPHVIQNLMTMDELLKFQKVKKAFEILKLNTENGNVKFGFSKEGLKVLGNRIGRWKNINNIHEEKWNFGDFSKSVYFIDNFFQYNISPIDCNILKDPIDDFFGAIGTSNLKIAARGEVSMLKGQRNKCLF